MIKIGTGEEDKNIGSPKVEIGEIDTRAPFQSVRAAVNLFVEAAISSKGKLRPTARPSHSSSHSFENVLNKETQLVLAQRELDKYKLRLQTAETAKVRASSELDKAKITFNDLTAKLQSTNQAKLSAVGFAESVKDQAKQLEVEKSHQRLVDAAGKQLLDQEREQYMIAVTRVDAAKQQLTKLRRDIDAASDSRSASSQRVAEAQCLANVNKERADELVEQVRAMKESVRQVKLASTLTQKQLADVVAEKDGYMEDCKAAKEEMDKKLESLRKQYDPEMTINLQKKLVETTVGIETLQEEIRKARALEMSTLEFLTAELNGAKKTLQTAVEQEGPLRNVITSLKLELEEVRKEKVALQMKGVKEFDVEERSDSDGLSEEQRSMLGKQSKETEMARRELEEMKKSLDKVKQEAGKSRLMVEEGKKRLQIVVAMVEQAKERERRANGEMKLLSQKQKNESQDPSNPNIMKMSLHDFEILKKKVEECDSKAEARETDAINEVEAIIQRKKVVENQIEENLKAVEEMKEAIETALQSAENAEAARKVVEGELQRWREKHPVTNP